MTSTRNMLCRCGSGKKTKRCCGVEVSVPETVDPDFCPACGAQETSGPAPYLVAFQIHDKRSVLRVLEKARPRLVPADSDGSVKGLSWEWMASADASTHSADVVLEGRCLIIMAPDETVVEECREFIAGLVGSAATLDGNRRYQLPTNRGTRERSSKRYPHLVADLGHYLDMGDLSIRVTGNARTIAIYLGRIAATASMMKLGGQYYTDVICRRRPDNRSCKSEIVAERHADGRVAWICLSCRDSGTITGWEETAFDARDRAAILDRNSDPETDARILVLLPKHVRRLWALLHHTAPALNVLASARRTPEGNLRLVGTRLEVATLARCITFHFARATNLSESAENNLHKLHRELAVFANVIPDLSPAAQCAEVLLFEHSRKCGPRPSPRDEAVTYRLRVCLKDIAATIWRQIEIPADFTLAELSDALILSFGWAGTHMHLFEQGDRTFGNPRPEFYKPITDHRSVRLGDVLTSAGASMLWEYDLGDSWRHEIVVEELLTAGPDGPRLLAGAYATPPEDCGGPPGYERLLEALRDPLHEDHESMREWSDDFDPEVFPLEKFSERVARLTNRT